MSETQNDRAVAGDNSKLSIPTQEELRDYLAERYGPEAKRTHDILEGIKRFNELTADGIVDDETMAKSSDFMAQIGRLMKTLEKFRTGEKTEWDQRGAIVQSFFKAGMTDPLERGANGIGAKQTKYLTEKERLARVEAQRVAEENRREAARKAAEVAEALRIEEAANAAAREAERKADADIHNAAAQAAADEARAAAAVRQRETDAAMQIAKDVEKTTVATERRAVASTADLTRTRGDFGGVTSLRSTVKIKLVDISKVPVDYLLLNETMAKAKGKGWKEGDAQPLPGIEFYIDRTSGTRG